MCVAAAGGYRIETILRQGRREHRIRYARIAIKSAATNTPQQIGNGTDKPWQSCLLKDGDFPPHVGGVNADWHTCQVPTLSTGRSYAIRSCTISHLISRDSLERAPSYTTRDTERSWTTELSKARCGFGLDSQTYRILNPSNGAVVESNATPLSALPVY